jgi:aspartyl-tRNA(Asn)/glutamyl-tRNA(Gln) amidotransferase subunit C
MSLDHATIRRIASLARIRVEEHEVENMCHELNGILGWIEQLNEVDVTGVAPLTGAANTGSANTGAANTGSANMAMAMRADVVTDGGYADKVLSNAPERIGDFYVVPKVVE